MVHPFLTFVKENLKLYLDFKSNKSDTLKFPSEGSTALGGANQTRYIDLGSDIEFTGEFSIGFWFNGDVNTDYKVIARTTTSPSNDIGVKDLNGQLFIRIGGNYSANANNVPNNTWSHIVFTRDSNNLVTAYVNGTSSNTNTRSGTFKFSKGGSNIYSAGADCKLANFFAYTHCLSPEEIQSIMNKSYSQLKGAEKTSLEAWWALDSASNGVVQPATGEVLGDELITKSVTDTWAGTGVTVNEASTEQVFSGTHSLKFVTSSDAGAKGVTSNSFTSVLNALYKIDFYVYTTDSDIEILVYQGDGSGTSITETITVTPNQWVNVVRYYNEEAGGASSSLRFYNNTAGVTAYIDNISLKRVTSNTGKVTGATTTTSVYGGNAPILPRAVDVAKEGQADAIGDGSASFNGTSDIIDIGSDSILDKIFNGGATLTAWIKPSSDGENNFGRIFDKSASTNGSNGWHWLVTDESSSKVELRFGHGFSGSQPYWDSSLNVALNEWNHVSCYL